MVASLHLVEVQIATVRFFAQLQVVCAYSQCPKFMSTKPRLLSGTGLRAPQHFSTHEPPAMPALLSQQFSLAPGQGQGQYTSLAVEPEALRRGLLQRRELPPLPENFTRTESRLTTLARRSRRDNTPYTLALETADGKRRRLSTTVAREPQNASGYDSNDDDDSDSDGDELAQALRSSRQHQRRSRVHKSNLDDGLAFMCASTLLYRAPLPEIPRLPRRYAYHVPTAAAATNLPLTGDRRDRKSVV